MSQNILFRATRAANCLEQSPKNHPLLRHIVLSRPLSSQQAPPSTPIPISSYALSPSSTFNPPDPLNPPSTTRPPPLTLPIRTSSTSTPRYLISLGKSYLTFYKTGLKAILNNRRLVKSLSSSTDSSSSSPSSSSSSSSSKNRSNIHLLARYTHDIRRLPIFALVLLICGEFTPLIVLLVPKIVPLTCRIPKQVDILLRKEEDRRATLRNSSPPNKERQLAGILSVPGASWLLPAGMLRKRIEERLEFLRRDDELIRQGGGVEKLIGEEVRLACADRGINVLGREEGELREALRRWLDLSGGKEGKRIAELILKGEEGWNPL